MAVTLFQGRLPAIAAGVLLAFLSSPAAFCQVGGEGDARYHNQRGVDFFKKGFYEHTPKNQMTDAERNYAIAIKEFQAAIAKDPSLTDAHRNLARLRYVQKDFEDAAQEYKKVTELSPDDIDAYVNLALSLIELERFDEAIEALESAKQQTSDAKALNTLDVYIAKILAHQGKEVR
jgi:tetratricopeptide (TPR) repeat protein